MAAVPEYQRKVGNRPTNQQAISVSTSADTFGAGIGQAAQQVGQGLFKAADAVDFRDQLTADAEAREAFNGYRTAQQQFLLDPEDGVLNQTGSNALGEQRDTSASLKGLRNRFGEGLSGRARKAYDQRVDDMEYQADQRILTHTANESRNYITNQRKSTVEGYVEEAITNWSDQELYDRNLEQALREQGELARLEGWDAATQQNAAEALISSTTRARIVQAGTEDPLLAEQMLENSRDILSAEDEHALDTGMKPMIQAAKVNSIIKPFVKSGKGAASGGGRTYNEARIQGESGGDPFAANNPNNPGYASPDGRYSSALGLNQQLRGTYLATVKQMQSEGGAAWANGLSDDEIARTRTNPNIDNAVQSYREEQEAAIVVANGFQDTPVTRYAMHHFGASGGIKLLTAARDNPGASAASVLGASVLKSNPQFKGLTAGEALDWTANHIGADDITASGGSFFDAEGAMQAALQIEDPELQAAALSKIGSLVTLQDKSRAMDRQSAQEQAWNNYVQTGVAEVPMDLKLRMGQGGWAAYQSAVENDMRGIDITNEETWETLTRAASDPKTFVEMNLIAHKPNLSDADYRHFVTAQEAAKAKLSGDALAETDKRNGMNFTKMFTTAGDLYEATVGYKKPSKMSDDDRRKRTQFERNLTDMAKDFFDEHKREPNDADVLEMARTMLMPTVLHDVANPSKTRGEGFLFEMGGREDGFGFTVAVEYEDVPYDDRARITDALQARGVMPSRDQITDAYETERMLRAGIAPPVLYSDVPEAFVNSASARYPAAGEGEIVEMFQNFLLDNPDQALGALLPAGPSVGSSVTTPRTPGWDTSGGIDAATDEPVVRDEFAPPGRMPRPARQDLSTYAPEQTPPAEDTDPQYPYITNADAPRSTPGGLSAPAAADAPPASGTISDLAGKVMDAIDGPSAEKYETLLDRGSVSPTERRRVLRRMKRDVEKLPSGAERSALLEEIRKVEAAAEGR